ncbi:MAG TPA: hypothetical protein VKR59_00090 [Terriglobales bacterium]|nr:hypothetical protein [Terriglobales bacterium]
MNCSVDPVLWNHRRAYRLSNTNVRLTVLSGGGHIADFRLRGSPLNVLWEAPWPTIEPQAFFSPKHAELYGDGPVGRFLCTYTGHALALGYFGMPSAEEAEGGMALHGESGAADWKVGSAVADGDAATLVMEVTLPVYRLQFRRELSLPSGAFTASITETVTNLGGSALDFQWVQHAAFGEPFFANGEATLFTSGTRGVTWPAGYEGHELLAGDAEFRWPYAQSVEGKPIDLSRPFTRDGTGFLAAVLADSNRENAFAVVHNRRHQLVAGYSFDPTLFPWIVLWEENMAREYVPWNKRTRARGVEFGTSPMPLGLSHAREMRSLFDAPVLTSIAASSRLQTQYDLFLHPVPPEWTEIKDVRKTEHALVLQGDGNDQIKLQRGKQEGQ